MAPHDNEGLANARKRTKQFGGDALGFVDTLHMIRYADNAVGFGNGGNGTGSSGQRGGHNAASHLPQLYA